MSFRAQNRPTFFFEKNTHCIFIIISNIIFILPTMNDKKQTLVQAVHNSLPTSRDCMINHCDRVGKEGEQKREVNKNSNKFNYNFSRKKFNLEVSRKSLTIKKK